MTDITAKPGRRPVARRARTVVAGLSAAAFVGFGATMAFAANGTPTSAAGTNGGTTTTANSSSRTPATVDPFAPLGQRNPYVPGGAGSLDEWGGQPAAGSQPSAGGSSSADTSTHGS
jgi:hypothetical protein